MATLKILPITTQDYLSKQGFDLERNINDLQIIRGHEFTPLMYAVFLGNEREVSIILKAGGQIEVANRFGETALLYAFWRCEMRRSMRSKKMHDDKILEILARTVKTQLMQYLSSNPEIGEDQLVKFATRFIPDVPAENLSNDSCKPVGVITEINLLKHLMFVLQKMVCIPPELSAAEKEQRMVAIMAELKQREMKEMLPMYEKLYGKDSRPVRMLKQKISGERSTILLHKTTGKNETAVGLSLRANL